MTSFDRGGCLPTGKTAVVNSRDEAERVLEAPEGY